MSGNTQEIPPVLLPYQQAWVEDASPVKVAEKGRRVGLSWAEAADCALNAASQTGSDAFYIGYNKEMAREFIDDCAMWARHYELAAGKIEESVFNDGDKDITTYIIRFASGFAIFALSSRPTNLRGRQGIAVLDEAAFHDNLDQLIKSAMAFLMWGGKVRIISTHNGDANPFNDLVGDIRAGKRPYSLHKIDFDKALAQGLYQRICLRLGKNWTSEAQADWRQSIIDQYGEHADEELFCIPAQGKGAFISRGLIESNMSAEIPVLRWACREGFEQEPEEIRKAAADNWFWEVLRPVLETLDPNRPTFFGEDFGRSGDLTVLALLQETGAKTYKSPCVIELRNTPFAQQWQIVFRLGFMLPRFSGAAFDARGNGQYLAELAMQAFGAWRIHQVMLSAGWYLEHMPPYKAALEDRALVWPLDPDLVDDHRALRMEKGYARIPENYRAKGRDGGQRHGDAAIACVMAFFAARNTKFGPIEFETTGVTRASTALEAY